MNLLYLRKFILIALGLVLMAFAGVSFYKSRHLKEPVVLSQGVTQVKKLSDYFPGIKGTINDSNIYVLEGTKPGGTILILGGTHPEEPGSRLTTWIFAENAEVDQGRLLVINSANRSATTVTRLGGGYPPDFTIPTRRGGQEFRMGDRFVVRAGKHGLLFEKMDENGWPVDVRVGRHCSTILQILELWSEENPEKSVR